MNQPAERANEIAGREASRAAAGPPCTFVAGPRGAGKTRWLQARIRELVAARPGVRCGIVLAEEGHTRMERFSHDVPGIAVRRVFLPCPCCPARAGLPEVLRQLAGETAAAEIFVEAPATAAIGLLGELDRELAWSRRLVVCLDDRWQRARLRSESPPFLAALLERADLIVPPPVQTSADVHTGSDDDAAPSKHAPEAPTPHLILP
ncbi:MAG: ATP-binding protein [Verrucomicrobia bacterium]|nr:ATP-binding protein [Verrucomicrobiota bacterium]